MIGGGLQSIIVKRLLALTLVIAAIALMATSPAQARGGGGGHGGGGHGGGHGHRGFHGRHHGRVFLGGGVFISSYYWDPFWWDYAYPPPIVVQPPPVYIEKHPEGYWYYCPSARAYYPTAPTCPERWLAVSPRAH